MRFVVLTAGLLLSVGLACGRSAPVVVSQPAQAGAAPSGPTQPAPGASRFNPAPRNTAIQIDNMTLSITDVVFPADSLVRQGSLWNPTPEPQADYILVGVAAACNLPPESSCRLSGLEFSLVDSSGLGHNPRLLIAGVAGKFEGGEFFGGATRQGYLIFVIEGAPADHVLKYQALLGGEAYLRLD